MPYAGVNGQRLYYEVGGDGELLVLLHGALSDADMMEAPATGLASGFRTVRYDRRGHGRTGEAPGPVRELLVPSAAFDAARDRDGLEERLQRMFLRSAKAAARFARAVSPWGEPQAARLSSVTARTAIFVGDRDGTDRLRCAEAIADGIPGAELVTFPGLGRFLHVEEPRPVMRRLTDFFLPEPTIER